jgi:argininosuccinate lyase
MEELHSISPLFGDEYYRVVDLERAVAAKISLGGTAPDRVTEQLALARTTMERLMN